MSLIYHLITDSAWREARSAPEYRAESLEAEGFIHCSESVEQMLRVANRLYAGRDDLMGLEVETDRLTSLLKREPSRSGEVYPHIYGPLNMGAVVRVICLRRGVDGSFTSVQAQG